LSYHHLAIATRDMQSTHEFYTHAMGFELVRAEKAQTGPEAWAKHFFYDTGNGEMMAFWEIHDAEIDAEFPTSISTGLGLPVWTNHIAFGAADDSELTAARERLLAAGHPVREIDHHWCKSIYAMDPNGIMVEFCTTTRQFDEDDRSRALAALDLDEMPDEPAPIMQEFTPQER
jgi:catechol 2,3-dioxygenase-like lactoylglutathione lyase family enzyme